MASTLNSPNKAASTEDLSDASPKPRIVSSTLPPQAAQAPEFVPGEEYQPLLWDQPTDDQKGGRKSSDFGSDKTEATEEEAEERTKAEKEAEEKAQKQQAMDEEWWTGDEDFAPSLKDEEEFWSNKRS